MATPPRNRRSTRLRSWDYGAAAVYGVTICTVERTPLFGSIVDGRLIHTRFGLIAIEEWRRTELLRPQVVVDAFVVMPDHVHAIIAILPEGCTREEWRESADYDIRFADGRMPNVSGGLGRSAGTLGSVVAGYKAAVTARINRFRGMPGQAVWQRNYWDRVIRNRREWDRFRAYIQDNPRRRLERETPHARLEAG